MDDIILDPLVSRRQSPLITLPTLTLPGNDSVKFVAGHNLNIPNVWGIYSARIEVTTDATVANRYLLLARYNNGVSVNRLLTGAIVASETKKGVIEPVVTSSFTNWGADYKVYTGGQPFGIISGDDYWQVNLTNGVAGDIVSIWVQFIWLNWNLGMVIPKSQRKLKE